MLLFWPCIWGLTLSIDLKEDLNLFIYYSFLFFMGSLLMRSAGCIVNDIVDEKYDRKVERTKNRPIASGKISKFLGFIYVIVLCLLALIVLLQFNTLTIVLAICSMPLAFIYPLMKRYTYWPQLFLGITFNYGLLLGWTSVNNDLNYVPLILYFGAIFWTLAYDTVYGFQDIKDDEIIGVKSTSIKFKKNPINFLFVCYLIKIISLLIVGYLMEFNIIYFFFLLLPIGHLFIIQLKKMDKSDPRMCLKIFKSNNFFGALVFLNILIGKIF
tara:strand:- start:106 stop:915 length:810 start_codon:yes stop_codon:yes gene_type:complete